MRGRAGLLLGAFALIQLTVACAEEETVEVPLRIHLGSLPFVEVSAEGQAPRWFLVDTGASVCAISSRLATTLPAVEWLGGEFEALGATGATQRVSKRGYLTLEVASWKFERVPTVVLDLDPASRVLGIELSGVLGLSCLMRSVVTIDYLGRKLVLGGPPLGPVDGETTLRLAQDPKSQMLLVPLTYRGRHVGAVLDTGAGGSLMFPDAMAARLPLAQKLVVTGKTFGLGKVIERREGRLATDFALGKTVIRRPTVETGDIAFRLGGEVLKHFVLTLDASRGRIRLVRPSSEPLDLPSVVSHGVGFVRDEAGWIVAYVLDGIPAVEEIASKDRVLSVNGTAAAELDPDWRTRLERTELSLVIERAGKTFSVKLPVVTLVE